MRMMRSGSQAQAGTSVLLLCHLATADDATLPRWTTGVPNTSLPRAGLPPVPETVFSVLARANASMGLYNNGPYLDEANGTMFATWFNCPRASETSCKCGERSLWSYSTDSAGSWSPAEPLFNAIEPCKGHAGTRVYPFVWARIACGVGCARLYGVSGVDLMPHPGPTPNSAFSAYDTAPKVMRQVLVGKDGAATLGPVFWAETYPTVASRLGFLSLADMPLSIRTDVQSYIGGTAGFAPNYGALKFGPGYQFITPPPASMLGAALDERSAYERRVGDQRQLVLLLRNDGKLSSYTNRLFASVRNLTADGRLDGADGWTSPLPTTIPDAPSRTYAGLLSPTPSPLAHEPPSPSVYLLGTQVGGDGARDPLTLSLSQDGIRFTRAFSLFSANDTLPLGIDTRGHGFSYPGGLVWNGTLFVAVAARKESIVLARVPIAALRGRCAGIHEC